MTSRDVAEMTGKRHADVCRDIRNEIEQLEKAGVEGVRIFAHTPYINTQNGQEYMMYQFGMEGALQLGARYSAETRRKMIERLKDLEMQKRYGGFQIPQTFKEALLLAVEQQEQIEQLAIEKAEAIRTKAHIGSKREASVMGKLSGEKKAHAVTKRKLAETELELLEVKKEKQLGINDYFIKLRDFKICAKVQLPHKPVVDYCREHGLTYRKMLPKDAFKYINADTIYEVNHYPVEAILAVYPEMEMFVKGIISQGKAYTINEI